MVKGWRTIFWNILVAGASASIYIEDQLSVGGIDIKSVISQYIDPYWIPLILFGYAIINIWLRFITTSPIGKAK